MNGNRWIIRLSRHEHGRLYHPIAILADWTEVKAIHSYRNLRDARLYVITKYDGGRAFPKAPKPFPYTEEYFRGQDEIRARHRGL